MLMALHLTMSRSLCASFYYHTHSYPLPRCTIASDGDLWVYAYLDPEIGNVQEINELPSISYMCQDRPLAYRRASSTRRSFLPRTTIEQLSSANVDHISLIEN